MAESAKQDATRAEATGDPAELTAALAARAQGLERLRRGDSAAGVAGCLDLRFARRTQRSHVIGSAARVAPGREGERGYARGVGPRARHGGGVAHVVLGV